MPEQTLTMNTISIFHPLLCTQATDMKQHFAIVGSFKTQ